MTPTKKKKDSKGRSHSHTDKAEKPYIERIRLINSLWRVAV